jgi:hypothetical protein
MGTISVILFTFLGALWLARFVPAGLQLHGLVSGILVSLVNLLFDIGSSWAQYFDHNSPGDRKQVAG